MKQLAIYIHGKGGSAAEAEHYRPLFFRGDVIGFDYRAQNPWSAKTEFSRFYDRYSAGYDDVVLIAGSIGAFFSMMSLGQKPIRLALLISPIVNMEDLIGNMMRWANVTEEELRARREIPTAFGETLSWDYLCYVREHPIAWTIPTHILYGAEDHLTCRRVMTEFADRIHASLTVMPGGEHWFHTGEQMAFLDAWVKSSVKQSFA